MRRVVLATALIASLAAGVPAFAQEATGGSAPAATPTAKPTKPTGDDPNRMVCTREHVVGSNRPQKVCMTASERERIRDASQRELDTTRRPGQQNPGEVMGGG